YMRANWLCGRFCVQASSFENYIAEKPFTDRFVQQSHLDIYNIHMADPVVISIDYFLYHNLSNEWSFKLLIYITL
ncbi:hypothetical protein, partial [Acinetobacter nosocomialis]|uniref:hypothetical protein n=1 Tax=Acinetobacter nosocomialis TaxID=106654 RepID=UPI001C082F56